MKQEIYINGEAVAYTLQQKNITAVMGAGYITAVPTPQDILRIVYLGLSRTCGLTQEQFVAGYGTGTVWTSKNKGQYTLWMIHAALRARIRQINRTTVN